jgi:sugar phosphate isomerase/epimerase
MKRCASLLFAATIAVAAVTCPAESGGAAKRDDSASESLGLKLSLQCWTYRQLSFFETVDRAKTLGIKYVEMFPGQKLKPGSDVKVGRTMSDEACDEILKKLHDTGVKLIAYGVDGVPTDEAGARKDFEWAKKMGITCLVTETTPNDMHDKLCREFNIRFALHNHPQSWPPDKVLAACEGHTKLIGSCSDTGHWLRRNLVPVEQMKKLQGRIEHLHFKDLNKMGDGHDVAWGTGVGDVKGMLAELKRQGYKGYLSIEFEYGNLEHLDENLPKCVAYFDEVCGKLAK